LPKDMVGVANMGFSSLAVNYEYYGLYL